MLRLLALTLLLIFAPTAQAQVSVAKEKPGTKNDPVPRSDTPRSAEEQTSETQPRIESRPRNDEESSSRDNIIDLRPPKNDNRRRPSYDDDEERTGVGELKPWNPHKAMKSVEVGEYHFKRKNYKAAISRFREALEYKPRDAEATYRLAAVLERVGEYDEALQRYEEYLAILKNGPYAEESTKAVARIKEKLAP